MAANKEIPLSELMWHVGAATKNLSIHYAEVEHSIWEYYEHAESVDFISSNRVSSFGCALMAHVRKNMMGVASVLLFNGIVLCPHQQWVKALGITIDLVDINYDIEFALTHAFQCVDGAAVVIINLGLSLMTENEWVAMAEGLNRLGAHDEPIRSFGDKNHGN